MNIFWCRLYFSNKIFAAGRSTINIRYNMYEVLFSKDRIQRASRVLSGKLLKQFHMHFITHACGPRASIGSSTKPPLHLMVFAGRDVNF